MVAPDLNLGIHSLRASGASAAANADGVTDLIDVSRDTAVGGVIRPKTGTLKIH